MQTKTWFSPKFQNWNSGTLMQLTKPRYEVLRPSPVRLRGTHLSVLMVLIFQTSYCRLDKQIGHHASKSSAAQPSLGPLFYPDAFPPHQQNGCHPRFRCVCVKLCHSAVFCLCEYVSPVSGDVPTSIETSMIQHTIKTLYFLSFSLSSQQVFVHCWIGVVSPTWNSLNSFSLLRILPRTGH